MMQTLNIYMHNVFCGKLSFDADTYTFSYNKDYQGAPISLTMPITEETYTYASFPPFFDGLLPEGYQLEGLLRIQKIDKYDYMQQLAAVGADLVGAVTIKEGDADE